MASLISRNTIASQQSQRILDDVIHDSQNTILQAQAPEITDALINIVWDSLGKYISRLLRQGRGVNIPRFGIFTFSAPVVRLSGVTNPSTRDSQSRIPVFIVSPEFVSGGNLKTGIFYGKTRSIRPYSNKGVNGKIQQAKCNYTDIAYGAGVKADVARIAVERVIKRMSNSVRAQGFTSMILPTVGVFHCRDGIVAVAFDDGLTRDTFSITNNNLSATDRKKESLKFLT